MADSRNWLDWVRYAEDDWLRALEDLERWPRGASFDLHQSCEKYLKAVLIKRQAPVPRLHDLEPLLDLIEPTIPEESLERQAALLLSVIVRPSRYPGNFAEPTTEEAKKLAEAARVLRSLARAKLGLEAQTEE
jgi:HEPN domain-containing protein